MTLGFFDVFLILFASGFVLEHINNQKEYADDEQEYYDFQLNTQFRSSIVAGDDWMMTL